MLNMWTMFFAPAMRMPMVLAEEIFAPAPQMARVRSDEDARAEQSAFKK